MIEVDFAHLSWRAMCFVVRYLYGGEGKMFNGLEGEDVGVNSVDEWLEFVCGVMAAAVSSELSVMFPEIMLS
jgi:hypothetical protein